MTSHARAVALVAIFVALPTSAPLQAQTQEIDALRARAEQGYAAALNNLGTMYTGGRGVPQDDAQAVGWYRLAAEQGYAAALNNLGIMYAGGRGVPQDDAEAVHWYRLAADQGVGIAQYLGLDNLGSMYAAGLRARPYVVQPRGVTTDR